MVHPINIAQKPQANIGREEKISVLIVCVNQEFGCKSTKYYKFSNVIKV